MAIEQRERSRRRGGELREFVDGRVARIRIAKGRRESYALDGCHDRESALTRCHELDDMAQRLRRSDATVDEIDRLLEMGGKARPGRVWDGIVKAVDDICAGNAPRAADGKAPITFTDFAKEWTTGALHKKYPDHVRAKKEDSARGDRDLLTKYIAPIIGGEALRDLRLEHFEEIMAQESLRKLSPTTRRHVAQVCRHVMSLAVYPAKHIATNPIPGKWLPRKAKPKAKACLYPAEDAKLLACTTIAVERRLAYGILVREGMRAGELAALKWRDVDLERGRIRLDENKTNDPRAWALRADVARALTWWKEQCAPADSEDSDGHDEDPLADDLVLPLNLADGAWWLRGDDAYDASKKDLTTNRRGDLRIAGVDRRELFERTAARQPLRLHDLRATFVTLSLASGKTEQWVTDRTGHRSSQMLALYTRQARTWQELGLGECGEMDELIPEIATAQADGPSRLPRGCPVNSRGERIRTSDPQTPSQSEGGEKAGEAEISRVASTLSHEVSRDGAATGQSFDLVESIRAGAPSEPMTIDVLRAKLDAAIVAEAWDAVKVIGARLREVERVGVVDFDVKRRRRGG